MARGLSDLQKNILILAYNNRDDWPHLFPGHVLFNLYGLPLQDGKMKFARAEIGNRYAAANVAVSKAFQRLQDRGLMEAIFVDGITRKMVAHGEVRLYHRGMKLTPDGIQTVEYLLGKTDVNLVLPNSKRED